MADVIIDNSNLYDIADSIRAKNGTATTYKPSEMSAAIDALPSGGITPTGTISITTNGTHDVTNYASAEVAVPTGSTPAGTKSISITANGTTTEDVKDYASAEITVNVSSGSSDEILNGIIDRTYSGILSLTGTKVGANGLRKCTGVTCLCMPNCTSVQAEGLKEMTSLTTVDLGSCASIDDMGFQGDSNLTTIILRRTTGICSLVSGRVFLSTRFVSGGAGGTVYVPSALISTYQSASNWSTIDGYGTITWTAIEGSQYENYYADGTVIS